MAEVSGVVGACVMSAWLAGASAGVAEVSAAVAELSAGVAGAVAAAGLRRRRRPLERAGSRSVSGTWPLATWVAFGSALSAEAGTRAGPEARAGAGAPAASAGDVSAGALAEGSAGAEDSAERARAATMAGLGPRPPLP
jgi:hypothetical protein